MEVRGGAGVALCSKRKLKLGLSGQNFSLRYMALVSLSISWLPHQVSQVSVPNLKPINQRLGHSATRIFSSVGSGMSALGKTNIPSVMRSPSSEILRAPENAQGHTQPETVRKIALSVSVSIGSQRYHPATSELLIYSRTTDQVISRTG